MKRANVGPKSKGAERSQDIYPVILAAGRCEGLLTGQTVSQKKARSWFRTALSSCAGLAPPVIVLGWCAERLKLCVPNSAGIVVNKNWVDGQITSLLAGLIRVPSGAAFMIYPVDLHKLQKDVIDKLVAAFRARRRGCEIIMPMYREHAGHPAILSGALRVELVSAESARYVVYRDPGRVSFVKTECAAVIRKRRSARTKAK
jgi:CTP:molybdopterin cytidylyltransferase MocA